MATVVSWFLYSSVLFDICFFDLEFLILSIYINNIIKPFYHFFYLIRFIYLGYFDLFVSYDKFIIYVLFIVYTTY